jgi:hypothetical protein
MGARPRMRVIYEFDDDEAQRDVFEEGLAASGSIWRIVEELETWRKREKSADEVLAEISSELADFLGEELGTQ